MTTTPDNTRRPQARSGAGRTAPRSRIRAFRMENPADRADAAASALDVTIGATAAERGDIAAARLARLLREERRRAGTAGYDVLRHAGLVRRMRALGKAANSAHPDA